MFLFCARVNPPGTSSCGKAQLTAAALPEWSDPLISHAHWEAWQGECSERPRSCVPACALPPSKPCGTLQYCVMAWEFILNAASSGKGQVLATRMGASGTCKNMESWLLERNSINFLPLNSPITMFEPELYNQSNVYFCQRQFWISHSLVNSNQLNKFTITRTSCK